MQSMPGSKRGLSLILRKGPVGLSATATPMRKFSNSLVGLCRAMGAVEHVILAIHLLHFRRPEIPDAPGAGRVTEEHLTPIFFILFI